MIEYQYDSYHEKIPSRLTRIFKHYLYTQLLQENVNREDAFENIRCMSEALGRLDLESIDSANSGIELAGTEQYYFHTAVLESVEIGEFPRDAFISSLREIIEDIRQENLPVTSAAVHLARTLQVWEVSYSIGFLEIQMVDLDHLELHNWLDLISAVREFRVSMDGYIDQYSHEQSHHSLPSNIESNTVEYFGEFINSLNLSDFRGKNS